MDVYFAVQTVEIIVVKVLVVVFFDVTLLVVGMVAVNLFLWQFQRVVVLVPRQRVCMIVVIKDVNVVLLKLLQGRRREYGRRGGRLESR